jgi:hypothetical protein
MGLSQCRPGRDRSVHPACRVRVCNVKLRPSSTLGIEIDCTFLNLVEHHSKESTVHRFEPARPRNRAQHIAANTE